MTDAAPKLSAVSGNDDEYRKQKLRIGGAIRGALLAIKSLRQHAPHCKRASRCAVLLALTFSEVLSALPEAAAIQAIRELRHEANAFTVS